MQQRCAVPTARSEKHARAFVSHQVSAGGEAHAATTSSRGVSDFSSLIAKEVSGLKDKKQQRFRFHDTGIRTLLFLEMPFAVPGVGPCEVCTCCCAPYGLLVE